MKTAFNCHLADSYKSASQKIRVMTENWVDEEVFCPVCGNDVIHYESNRPVADFFCKKCEEDYELKSKKDAIGDKIIDGAYGTMIKRLTDNNNPNLFLLNYSAITWKVLNFFVIPKHFFVTSLIEERKPLSVTARRAGWVGCNILLHDIPQTGKIFYIKNSLIEPKDRILSNWQKTKFLREEKEMIQKGWILDVMNCIDKLGKNEFRLDEIYIFEEVLSKKHPSNKHIKDKIRQQLQLLRDKGYLNFTARGRYKIT